MMHYGILDENRKKLLTLFDAFKNDFYLAGGTGLALQIGHRDSADFDFFTARAFDTAKLSQKVERIFSGYILRKVQEEEGTLTYIVGDNAKLSFFHYPYQLLFSVVEEPFLKIASLADIAAMKIAAIVSRATMKDYVDIYFLFNHFSFEDMLSFIRTKFPSLDENLIRKSMVYFDDVTEEKLVYKTETKLKWEEIKARIKKEVLGDQ